jgi:hypothetical protein
MSKTCTACGASSDLEGPTPNACTSCPPSICVDCGGVNHLATDRSCVCWVNIEDVSLADVKALFARDGTFNVTTDGDLSTS